MRHLEQTAFDRGMTIDDLMRRAAEAVADAVLEKDPGNSVLVLAGPGNNGGDGVLAAAMLQSRGLNVSVYTFRRENTEPYSGDVVRSEDDSGNSRLRSELGRAGVVVDSLLGTGQNRPPDEALAEILSMVETNHRPGCIRISVDVPTGVDADTGAVHGPAFKADETVSMGFPKVGLLTSPGSAYTGRLRVVDIGLPPDLGQEIQISTPEPADISRLLPRRDPTANKGSSGRLQVISGSRDFTGAPVLCSMSAYRVGAGLVEIATPSSAHPIVAAHVLEPVFRPLLEADGRVAEDALEKVKAGLDKAKACVVGPGLGLAPSTIAFINALLRALREKGIPAVVDADGLNALSELDEWWETKCRLVLTPHPGEMSRLTGLTIQEIQQDRLRIATQYASSWDTVVVLKGAGTVVASPDGRAVINSTGGPNLATAGTGDVLSGIIGGLLTQGLSPFDAAVCGVYLHGHAGDLLQREHGELGTIASDLIDILPKARRSILEEAEVQA